jgi:hypothetical protein
MKDWLKYDDLINVASHLNDNKEIVKLGLLLTYEIDPVNHKKLDETLYYKANPQGKDFKHGDTIELTIGGINILIKQKKTVDN